MKLNDLCGDETSLSQDATEITGLTADSREVQPGFLFAALPGTQVNGARFVTDAVTRGASAILAPEGLELDSALSVPIIRDAAPRRRLALMAARFYGRQPATCVAITGTNGKTSVASFVRQIWEAQDLFAASMGTTEGKLYLPLDIYITADNQTMVTNNGNHRVDMIHDMSTNTGQGE
ncbi:MAG: Mur ligase domain-containing protein [Alphaproteobacteria bacterium]